LAKTRVGFGVAKGTGKIKGYIVTPYFLLYAPTA
jgi:hypothetical protein